MESPPKRVTRSRAAAKDAAPATRTTRIVTAAARAKASSSAATAPTRSTASKRKTRGDDADDTDDQDEITTRKATRGRLAVSASNQEGHKEFTKTTAARSHTTRKATTEDQDDELAPVPRTRGRPKKTTEAEAAPAEASTKVTRARAGTASRATGPTKSTIKKAVKFDEPDKENIEPQANKESASTTSMRGRAAVRRGGATSARGGRATSSTTTTKTTTTSKKPLSPKKVTQMPVRDGGDSSEDELAVCEKKKPKAKTMAKSPVRPPSSAVSRDFVPAEASPAKGPNAVIEVSAASVGDGDVTKKALGSPARRLPASPHRETLKSPAKRIGPVPLPGSAMKPSTASSSTHGGQMSGFKHSLLQSAAKRPTSPIKGLILPPASTQKSENTKSIFRASALQSPAKRAMPGFQNLTDRRRLDLDELMGTPQMKPLVAATPCRSAVRKPSEKLMDEAVEEEEEEEEPYPEPVSRISFPGRLSDVLSRADDPEVEDEEDNDNLESEELQLVDEQHALPLEPEASKEHNVVYDELEDDDVELVDSAEEDIYDPMALDDITMAMQSSTERLEEQIQQDRPPVEPTNSMFQLRQKDRQSCGFSDSEEEPTERFVIHEDSFSPSKDGRRTSIGLGSLAEQLQSWSATSPVKPATTTYSPEQIELSAEEGHGAAAEQETLAVEDMFEEEMSIRRESIMMQERDVAHAPAEDMVVEPEFEEVDVIQEDLDLAHEADEMSHLEPDQVETVANHQAFNDSLSEASQEYGDENQVPVDPALVAQPSAAPVTPVRPATQTFNTTTKIPLKPADESTPSPLKKRSHSTSRVLPRRPGNHQRHATVISYSPTKSNRRSSLGYPLGEQAMEHETTATEPVTPTRSDVWASMGTPVRTPRRDVNRHLLRGAVVFVDVHTSEGADASGIFVELLTQMGARCVKTWSWNPNGSDGGSTGRVGITHVVYKDGGKRTLEKVRQSKGLVRCVGVSWVLDCERENEWLDEGPYSFDTSMVPRGGARRRKSMEPKQFANINGTLVSSSSKGGSRENSLSPNTPLSRRDSSLWMLSPSEPMDGEEQNDDIEWSKILLTPVPRTPAPEAVARYAAEIPETPSAGSSFCAEDGVYGGASMQDWVPMTCPPKKAYQNLGEGILAREKDEQVMAKLMAARRKSLQFAPKVASPLSRMWA